MNSTAAVPFELPTRSASDSDGLSGSVFSMARSASAEPGDGASFDDVLKANAPAVPKGPLVGSRSDRVACSEAQPESRGASLVVPANVRDRVPMPASLVRRIGAEEDSEEAVDGESSGEIAEEPSSPIAEVVFEWVCSLNQLPPPELNRRVLGENSKEKAVGSSEAASGEKTAAPTSSALSPGVTVSEPADGTDGFNRPEVLRREIVVSGRRMEASSLGEFAVAGAGSRSRPSDAKAGARSPAPTDAAETVRGQGFPLAGFEPVTGDQAISVLRSLFSAHPERPKRQAPTEQLGKVLPSDSLSSGSVGDLLKVVESRLKAEGIRTAEPIRIEVLKTPTADEPGEFKVEAGGRKVLFAGWWDKEGKILDAQAVQGQGQSQTQSDGKNQPGTPTAPPNRLAEAARFPESDDSPSGADSSAKQGVSAAIDQPKPMRIPSVATGGISTARQAIVMRSTNDQEEFAGNAGSRISANRERTGETIGQGSPRDLLTELAAMPFADRPDRLENTATLPGLGIDRIGQADRIDKMDAVEKMRSVISHELAVLKTSGADALAVVIRPTADSEVFIQLTREKGGIEAFIRMEKGDPAELRRQWSHLEGALADQQVKLQPLQSGSSMMQDSDSQTRHSRFSQQQDGESSGAKFSFDGNSRGGFRQEDPRRPQSPFESESPLSPRNPNPSTPRSAPRRGTSTDRNFDNWA